MTTTAATATQTRCHGHGLAPVGVLVPMDLHICTELCTAGETCAVCK